MINRKKILIFGAGAAGVNAYYLLKNKYDVLFFIDNDQKKHGSKLLGLNIIAAEEVKNYIYDIVFIASSYQYQIFKQLTENNIVPRAKIEFVPKEDILGKSKVYYFAFMMNVCVAIFFLSLLIFILLNWI